MPLVLVLVGLIFLFLYVKKDPQITTLKGLELGFLFFIISIVFDLFMFMGGGPMSFSNYMLDIGLAYLIYPMLGAFYGLIFNER